VCRMTTHEFLVLKALALIGIAAIAMALMMLL
jgi:hypothetical protein